MEIDCVFTDSIAWPNSTYTSCLNIPFIFLPCMHSLFGGKAHYLGTSLQWINLEIKCGCSNLYKGWAQEREQENNQ